MNVVYLFIVHCPHEVSEEVKARFIRAVESAKASMLMAKVTGCVAIIHSDQSDLAFLKESLSPQLEAMPVLFFQRPRTITNYEGSLEWAYNTVDLTDQIKLDIDYIFVNHIDDIPAIDRVQKQIQSLEDHPHAVLSLCGVHFYDAARKKVTCDLNFKLVDSYGFNVGYPSCWCFAKKRLPQIQFAEIARQDPFHSDVIFLINLMKGHDIVALHKPLVEYYFHEAPFSEEVQTQSWHDLMQLWQSVKIQASQHFVIDYQLEKKPVIMLIGPYNHQYYGEIYAKELEQLGASVLRVGTDIAAEHGHYNLVQNPDSMKNYEYYHVGSLVQIYKPDWVLLWQADIGLDFDGNNTPTFIVQSEILWKRWPKNCNVVGFIYSYFGAPAYFHNSHTFDLHGLPQLFLPYAWSPAQFPLCNTPIKDRKVFCGFMGSIGNLPVFNPHDDYIESQIRQERIYYLSCMKGLHWLTLQPKALNAKTMFEDYWQFMSTVKLAINIASKFGCVNERQFHALGMGCVLLQWRYKDIETLGFIDKKNCLLFSSKWELFKKLLWAKMPWNRRKLEAIQKEGFNLALQHTYHVRAPKLFQFMIDVMKYNKPLLAPPAEYVHDVIHDLGIQEDKL